MMVISGLCFLGKVLLSIHVDENSVFDNPCILTTYLLGQLNVLTETIPRVFLRVDFSVFTLSCNISECWAFTIRYEIWHFGRTMACFYSYSKEGAKPEFQQPEFQQTLNKLCCPMNGDNLLWIEEDPVTFLLFCKFVFFSVLCCNIVSNQMECSIEVPLNFKSHVTPIGMFISVPTKLSDFFERFERTVCARFFFPFEMAKWEAK